jgi:glutamine amidotransferase
MTIAVVDYGMGNLRSVAKALVHVAPKADVVVTSDAAVVDRAERVVLPGQSAMPDCMRMLDQSGLVEPVRRAAATRPFLGICLGLQMLFGESAEGPSRGLGILAGEVVRFDEAAMATSGGERCKVPHMGWNRVLQRQSHPLWSGIDDASRFYFAHSFHPAPADRDIVAGETLYPSAFTCAIAKDNIFATQFHPEKSHRAGLRLLANFVAWNGH